MNRYFQQIFPLVVSLILSGAGLSGCASQVSPQESELSYIATPPAALDVDAIVAQYPWSEAQVGVKLDWIIAVAQNGNWREGSRLLDEHISSEDLRVEYVQALAEAAPWIAEKQEAVEILAEAERIAARLAPVYRRALEKAKLTIRAARVKIGELNAPNADLFVALKPSMDTRTKLARQLLEMLKEDMVEPSENPESKADRGYSKTITEIAKHLALLYEVNPGVAQEMMQQLEFWAAKLIQPEARAVAFQAIARTYIQLDSPKKAGSVLAQAVPLIQAIPDAQKKAKFLRTSALLYAQLNETEQTNQQMEEAIAAIRTIEDPLQQLDGLGQIIHAYSQIPDLHRGQELVAQATSLFDDQEPVVKGYGFQTLAARVYYDLGDVEQARQLLQQALMAAELGTNPYAKATSFRVIAQSLTVLNEDAAAQTLLDQALSDAATWNEIEQKSLIVSAAASTYNELSDPRAALTGLKATLEQAGPESVYGIIRLIALKETELGAWQQALQTLNQISIEEEKLKAIAQLLTRHAEYRYPGLINGAVVLGAKAKPSVNNHDLLVQLHSPDRSCTQYADWWEVLDAEGNLIQRQLLNGPRFDQPISSTLQLDVPADQPLFIRAHLHQSPDPSFERENEAKAMADYGAQQVLSGTLDSGFKSVRVARNFGAHLKQTGPQPESCME